VPPIPPPTAVPLAWAIEVEPATVSMAKRASVTVRISATNHGTAARSPDRDPLGFHVDGATSHVLELAFGNGGRGREWTSLPPGATATDERNGMEIVDQPGDHVIAIVHGDTELARTILHVTR
jgi:hypothetical protein